uniref:Transcription initiation factor IIF subunit alpha n=1 Tax=Culex tarsalis TaxID=7177 RepID=A0A1Q3FWS1_CULTA
MSGPSGQPSGSGSGGPPASVQEFTIRVPKHLKKKYHVMRFNATLNVDFTQWRTVKMERENNLKEFKGMDEDMPKFGAGSEFNRDLREEARRKRYGIIAKKYRPEAQPWILKAGGKKDGKKFRGIREGGVGENAAFYVFTHAPDGAIEAYPLHEWYNFQPIQRYKALSAEEAEAEFGRRKKVMNYFSLMLKKRMKGDEEAVEEQEEAKAKKGAGGGKAKDLKISDMDEWMDDSEEQSSSDDEDGEGKPKEKDSDDEKDKKANKKKALADSKKKKRDVDEEAFEESDDGDEEGRELDYISDSSESESEPETKANKELKSVAEEDALRKLLTSDEDSEDEEKKSDDEENKKDEDKSGKAKEKEKVSKEKDSKEAKKKKKDKKKKKKADNDKKESSSSSSDSSDSGGENSNSKQKKKHKKDKEGHGSNLSSANNSRSASPSVSQFDSNKRKMGASNNMPTTDLTGSDNSNSPMSTPAKKAKFDGPTFPPTFSGLVSSNSKDDYGITEEAVRRYLMRKPMTTTELLTKFKNKKTGVSSEKLVETMTAILKKINPVKQTIQGKMYLSIKVPK